ncbi:MAG: hypothetical protein DMF60_04290 [Acidobacteria bacterium]|nr:MAG: hypothetical protein DMF60_04290 [Acidobacteriota bacterium]
MKFERSSLRQSLLRLVPGCAFILIAVAAFGCGKPFNVKKQPDLPRANYATRAMAGNVSVQAQALTDEDFLYDTFDANLLLAGVLAVRVALTNSGEGNVDLKEARFEVRATAGTSFKAVTERQAFKRLISYYEISTYNKAGYKDSLEAFSAYGLDTRTPLAGGQSRQGLLFFSMPSEAAQGGGLTLVVNRLEKAPSSSRGTLELKLN